MVTVDKRAIVLLSGGLDSVVNYKKALAEAQVVLALTFDYGQESAKMEIRSAESICKKYGTPHKTVRLDFLAKLTSGLTTGNIPDFDPSKLDEKSYASETAKAVWVPNRNGIFINIAAAFAEELRADLIVTGFNREEAATFPDNTPEFMERATRALEYSANNKPRVISYTSDMTKNEIVHMGKKTEAPLEYVWSCYHNGRHMCGRCESCRRLVRALEANALLDEFNKTNHWGIG